MKAINVIRKIGILFLLFCNLSCASNLQACDLHHLADTIYILYENLDYNEIDLSKNPTKDYDFTANYPRDWDRKYNILIGNHVYIWFYYFNNLPENSDLVFEYKKIDRSFIENHDFKDQEWFRKTPKEEIYDLFLGKEKVVYLVEKDRIKDGKAIMIRVYPDIQTVE